MARTSSGAEGRGRRFERRWILAVALLLAVWASVVTYFSFTESERRNKAVKALSVRNCAAINRSNAGNRAAWQFMEQTVRAGWVKNPPTRDQRTTVAAFFGGINERLRPVDC